jgi:aspartate carbamoyltransferase catalytic subunit
MWVPKELELLAPGQIRRVARVEDALAGADIILVLRVQTERLHEPALSLDDYVLLFQLTPARLTLAQPSVLVLHPGPMIRGLEIAPEVADGPQSCVREQVTNGLAVRMALLYLLIGTPESRDETEPPAQAKDATNAAD